MKNLTDNLTSGEETITKTTDVHEYTLIDGDFDLEESREILMNLLNSKIKFHNQRIFGMTVRSGDKDSKSEKRILELSQTISNLKMMLDSLESGSELRIDANIKVSIK
jgi:hypothetical protein